MTAKVRSTEEWEQVIQQHRCPKCRVPKGRRCESTFGTRLSANQTHSVRGGE